MRTSLAHFVLTALAVIAFPLAASGQSTPTVAAPVIYRLEPAAQFERGCFPPCLCPTMHVGRVRGTMVLTPVPSGSNTVADYAVSDVNWLALTGNIEWRITGSGVLHRAGGPAVNAQRLELDLKINSESVQHFDSGWVPASAVFPVIDLSISVNGGVCFDTVIDVIAAPVPVSQLSRYRLANTGVFITGCFPPCMCPLLSQQLGGWFTLVPIPALNTTPTAGIEYAVVNVQFAVRSPSPHALSTVRHVYRGFGFYRRNLPSATPNTPSQRMFLDLRTTNAAALQRFDSGVTPTTVAWPAIDLSLSKNGMVCVDTVFDFLASPALATP